MNSTPAYALVTAAYNEETLIEDVIRSVVAQTVLPRRWVIVSDGSTDRTDEIVLDYASRYPFIQLERITEEHARNFAAQVIAINRGFARCKDADYSYIGNLDADITLEPDYFERLFAAFDRDPGLGLAGGRLYERSNGVFEPRAGYNLQSVPHGVQMFRREVLETVGDYVPLPYGGPDWHIEVRVRMKGWGVHPVSECTAYHHRPTGAAGGVLRYCYRQGRMDYALGSHPVFETIKLVKRAFIKPYFVGSFVRFAGFASAVMSRETRPVSNEFMQFIREEQMGRVRRMWRSEPVMPTNARAAIAEGNHARD